MSIENQGSFWLRAHRSPVKDVLHRRDLVSLACRKFYVTGYSDGLASISTESDFIFPYASVRGNSVSRGFCLGCCEGEYRHSNQKLAKALSLSLETSLFVFILYNVRIHIFSGRRKGHNVRDLRYSIANLTPTCTHFIDSYIMSNNKVFLLTVLILL